MSKKILLARLAALGLAASALVGCNDSEKPAPAKIPVATQPAHPKQAAELTELDKTYEAIRTLYEGFRSFPNLGRFEGKQVVKIGFGTPVLEADFMQMEIEQDKSLSPSARTSLKQRVYQTVQSNGNIEIPYRVLNYAIRDYTKAYLAQRETAKYRPLAAQYGMDYDKLDPRVRASFFCIDMANAGQLETYRGFLTAVASKDWARAERECRVDEKQFKRNNPDIVPTAGRDLNEKMTGIFTALQAENTTHSIALRQQTQR